MDEKIQKTLARLGAASRRGAEEMILQGRVTVNGRTAEIGMRVDPDKCHIKVDGKLISMPEPKVYYVFNKPPDVVSTLYDPQGRRCIGDYVDGIRFRVFPVGRLDYHSEGLMIITNDGELANSILHPSRKLPKTYHVKVSGMPEEASIARLRKGIRLEDGMTAPAKARILRQSDSSSWLEIVIHEGKKRQIRRMLEALGHKALKLRRVRIGGLSLGSLKTGELRRMTREEVTSIKTDALGAGSSKTISEIKHRAGG